MCVCVCVFVCLQLDSASIQLQSEQKKHAIGWINQMTEYTVLYIIRIKIQKKESEITAVSWEEFLKTSNKKNHSFWPLSLFSLAFTTCFFPSFLISSSSLLKFLSFLSPPPLSSLSCYHSFCLLSLLPSPHYFLLPLLLPLLTVILSFLLLPLILFWPSLLPFAPSASFLGFSPFCCPLFHSWPSIIPFASSPSFISSYPSFDSFSFFLSLFSFLLPPLLPSYPSFLSFDSSIIPLSPSLSLPFLFPLLPPPWSPILSPPLLN